MPETSRECVVILPDDTQITIPVQPALQAGDLLNMAASHCKMKEKHYFGLVTEGDGYRNWLELDKAVLDPAQDLPKGNDPIKLHFTFKYYVDTYEDLQDHTTVEMLFLQTRKFIEKSEIITDEQTVYELAGLVMRANYGSFTSEEEARKILQGIPIIPAYIFQKQSVKGCEDCILRYYKLCPDNLSRGEAIFRYLEIVQSLPMYSYHYFEVKDKNNVPLWLGVGTNGIVQCYLDNRNEPIAHYQWMNLQNIYYKDKKFSVEVYTNSRSPRKTYQSNSVALLAWYGKNPKVVVAIWKMVRDQHMFYRSKRSAKSTDFHTGDLDEAKPNMTMTEILRHLNRKHRHGGSISPSSSHSSLSIESAKSNQATGASAEAVAAAKKAQQEMYGALSTTRDELVDKLEKKLTAYKDLLLKEMQITGVPPEGLTAEEIEKMRTKFGINFKFSKFVLDRGESVGEGDAIEELEKQLEVQSAIIEASRTLVDQAKSRAMKKDRKKEVKRAEDKYQKLEDRLVELKRSQRRPYPYDSRYDSPGFSLPPPNTTGSSTRRSVRHTSPSNSTSTVDDSYLAKMIFDDSPQQFSPLITNQKASLHKSTSALHDVTEMPRPSSPPSTHRQLSGSRSAAYHGHSPYLPPGDRSHHSSYMSDLNDSFIGTDQQQRSPRTSVTSFGSGRYDPDALRGGSLAADDISHHYSRNKQSSPIHGRLSLDNRSPGGPYYNQHQLRSSPELMNSPSHRSSYRSSAGLFSPEPPHLATGARSRPQSSHSTGTPPPQGIEYHSQRGGIRNNREMDLQEALLMDQDEGTLV
ncbi:PREDICTED: FERM domain-containing protein 4A-like isoform X2 [Amphimedon queenslandica]|uniref:FERM domain-containing protein n=1 Tax=Amphimedon queenslandica TaxID=400682 RepID=A0A1X7VUM6_AMPQE|nr:PREDICTED: FERM domain-containing protein 4A-like isoform X2 [Amphimedon queenslandica]|eukprot:XP_003382747.1 PREDICTED: FERM domain-containing protein 4A-like isoform X2 [Amphimedon queenslandica]